MNPLLTSCCLTLAICKMNNREIKEAINDKFMMNQCVKTTEGLLKLGMNIDKICELIKDYQRKYLHIKTFDENLAKLFTFEMWYNIATKK